MKIHLNMLTLSRLKTKSILLHTTSFKIIQLEILSTKRNLSMKGTFGF